MVTICALTTNSTIFVGLYFADPNNWLTAGFFRHGINGVMKGASNYLCAYIGIETLSFLLEETKKPRKRLPFIVPFIIAASTVILFLTTMVITLVADITKYPDEMLFPSVFDKLRMPSAKYIMTIGSVCGLSGTMLAIFLPATRIIASLCGDNLLPLNLLAHTSKKRGVPYYAGCLVYDQRYRPNVTGLFRETAFYHDIHRKRYKLQSSSNNFTDEKDSCSVTISRWSTDDENSILMSSYEIIRGILAEQEEAAHCQQLFEKLSSINEEVRLSLYDNNEEKISLLDKQCNALRNSQSLTENLKETMIKLCKNKKRSYHSSFDASDFGHNCARSPCSPPVSPTDFRGHNFHIFEHDIPDIPYYNRYTGSVQSSKSFNKNDYKRSMRILLLFILTSIMIAFLAMKTENNLATLHLFLPTLAACIFLAYLTVATARQAINPENNERSCKIIAFPYLTLLTIFLAIFVTCTTDYGTIMEFIIWLVIGTIFYALYGYKHSKERCTTLNGLIISNTKKESSSTGIMNISNAESTGIML
uniref:Cationic amino acid transporter C-terminal domain-containing protein n=1 Tax=Setaria digitata TaxID=48799 RepID=A0A915PYL9_9BILA